MALDRQEYPGLLASLSHNEASSVLDHRVLQIGRLNTDIANWLQERRRIEDQYASSLRKLAKRPAVEDPADLGILSAPWSSLVDGLATLAESHHALARKIDSDVERPLRDFQGSSRELQAMSTMQNNLTSMARDFDSAQKRADKLNDRNNKCATNKVANITEDLDNARSQWDAQAPYIFESLQSVDETRMNLLRDVLTQFQTHEMDQLERDRKAVERSLNTLVTVETIDEIKTFVLRTLSNKSSTPVTERRRSRSSVIASSPITAAFSPSTLAASPSVEESPQTDTVSELPSSSSKSDKPRGFRRLGSVLARRRQSKMPAGADRIAELAGSPERRRANRKSMMQGSSTFASLTNRMAGRSRDALSLEPPQEDASDRPRSPLRNMSSMTDASASLAAVNGNKTGSQLHGDQSETLTTHMQEPSRSELDQNNASGPSNDSAQQQQNSDVFSDRREMDDPISRAQREAAGEANANQLNVNIRDAPTVRDEGDADALANVANTLKMQAPQPGSRKAGTVRGRREMRASVYGTSSSNPYGSPGGLESQPINQSVSPGISEMATPSNQQSLPKSVSQPFLGTSVSSISSFSPAQLPPFPIRQSSLLEDSGSVRSGRSLSSTTSMAHKHPEPEEPGLNMSVIETVSAWIEEGRVSRSVVIGEIALGYKSDASTNSQDGGTIRIENFAQLDKVAPNPAFVSPCHPNPDSGDIWRPGEYAIDYKQLSRSQVAFKYQVSVSVSTPGVHAPLLMSLVWKIEDTHTSAIVTYGPNSDFDFKGLESVTLRNVTLALYLGTSGVGSTETGRATSCQSKPAGVFNKERNCMYLTLGELVLSPSTAPQRVLARFTTERGPAKAGKIDAKWEMVVDGPVGSGIEISVCNVDGAVSTPRPEDPFSDQDASPVQGGAAGLHENWERIRRSRRKLVAGTYTGT